MRIVASKSRRTRRRAMTLIEVVLALALTVVVAGLVGGLTQWYVHHRTRSDQKFAELRLARTLLAMIADDLRCVVRSEPLDLEPLKELLAASSGGGSPGGGASAGGSAGGGSAGGGTSGEGDSGGDELSAGGELSSGDPLAGASSSGGLGGGGQTGGLSSLGSQSGRSILSGDTSTPSAPPPGIYATETALEVDVSLVPRPDQAIVLAPDLMGGTLTDLPTDVKNVSYFIQPPGPSGVQDPLAGLIAMSTTGSANGGIAGIASSGSGGLVRRSLARMVVQKAYVDGMTDQLYRTGDLIAPEAVGLAFEFYDGTQWLTSWDSSAQSLPLVVRVMLALQDPSVPADQRMQPPIPLQTIAAQSLAASGIHIYSTLVPIPGATLAGGAGQTSAAGTGTADTSGMSAMGL